MQAKRQQDASQQSDEYVRNLIQNASLEDDEEEEDDDEEEIDDELAIYQLFEQVDEAAVFSRAMQLVAQRYGDGFQQIVAKLQPQERQFLQVLMNSKK